MSFGRRAALAIVITLLFGTGLFVAFGGDGGQVQISKETKTRLYVRTVPAGAEIALDGEHRGTSNRLFVVPPGVRRMTVEVELDGHGKQRRVVEIEGGRIERVEFEFDELPEVTGPGAPQPTGARDGDFGPVIERVVQDDKTGKDWLMDLDTGRLYTPPRELDPEQNREADHKELEAWTIRQGIDLSGIKAGTGVLYGLDLQVAVMSAREKPGKVGREEVLRALADPAARVAAKPLGSVLVTRLERLPDGDAYAFKSREGRVGVLQIQELADDGRGVKVRYSLLENDTARSIGDRVTNPPEGWKVLESFIVNANQTTAIARKLGGRISKLSNTVFSVDGQRVQINVFECAAAADADTVHKAVLDTKGHPAYCLRLGNVLVEFVGEFDVEFARRLARELELGPDLAKVKPIESRVLRQEFGRLLGDAVAARKQAGGEMPEGWDTPEFMPAMIERFTKEFPGLLLVTPEREKRLAAGKFDDADAAKALNRTIEVLDDFEVELPWLCQYVVEQFEAGKLKGARLELASRLMLVPIKQLTTDLSGDRTGEAEEEGARLDYRIAPTQGKSGKGTLKPEQVERYVKEFQDRDKWPQRPVAWFECDADVGDRLITAKDDDGRRFVLLSTEPDETMLAVEEGRKPWRLVKVAVEKDVDDQPTIGVEFDDEGARRFAALTSNHLRQPLAMLVGGKVVYAPTIQTTVSKRAIITGQFSEQEIERMVKSLIKGMVHP